MYVVQVVPILRGIVREHLSYFTTTALKPGAVVRVPLHKRLVPAVVVSLDRAADLRSELRAGAVSLRNVCDILAPAFFNATFMESAVEAARYFASTTGSLICALIPKIILVNAESLSIEAKKLPPIADGVKSNSPEKLILQAPDEERFVHYKSLIREEFARNASVYLCLPTLEDLRRISLSLPKGIEQYTYIFHSALSKRSIIELWQRAAAESHPILIVATGHFFAIDRRDLQTIVVERENSSAYKLPTRPYIDLRTFAEIFSRKTGARLIFGDLLLRSELFHRYQCGEVVEFAPLKLRFFSPATETIVDMRKYRSKMREGVVISDELRELVKDCRKNDRRLFIFAARRGLSPMSVCRDCGSVLSCSRCTSPLILHERKQKTFFLCHKCSELRGADEHCGVCKSWNIESLGIGVERVQRELRDGFPDLKLYVLTRDIAPTYKQGLEIIRSFNASEGSILLGTERALLYLEREVDCSAVASIDSLFGLPDFRINERVLSILLRLKSLTRERFLIQTRRPGSKVFEMSSKGTILDFFKAELKDREAFGFPPYTRLVKVTRRGSEESVTKEMEWWANLLKGYETIIYPAFTERIKGKFILHGLLRLPKESWPEDKLLNLLLGLPPKFTINVDPETLL